MENNVVCCKVFIFFRLVMYIFVMKEKIREDKEMVIKFICCKFYRIVYKICKDLNKFC